MSSEERLKNARLRETGERQGNGARDGAGGLKSPSCPKAAHKAGRRAAWDVRRENQRLTGLGADSGSRDQSRVRRRTGTHGQRDGGQDLGPEKQRDRERWGGGRGREGGRGRRRRRRRDRSPEGRQREKDGGRDTRDRQMDRHTNTPNRDTGRGGGRGGGGGEVKRPRKRDPEAQRETGRGRQTLEGQADRTGGVWAPLPRPGQAGPPGGLRQPWLMV